MDQAEVQARFRKFVALLAGYAVVVNNDQLALMRQRYRLRRKE
jgi:hypothetical protein